MKFLTIKRSILPLLATCLVLTMIVSWKGLDVMTTKIGREHACKLHTLDPWEKTIMEFVKPPAPYMCEKNGYAMFYVNETGYLCLRSSMNEYYRMTSPVCVYHVVHFGEDDSTVELGERVVFNPPVFVKGLVFKVLCHLPENSQSIIYSLIHFNYAWDVPMSKTVEREDEETYSVIFFGIDSLSRSQAIRQLPRSYQYFLKELNGFDFKGYMKVGFNTYPNLVPLLTGRPHSDFRSKDMFYRYMDDLPYIWNERKLKNYVTFYAEDRQDIATFNYLHRGFKSPPTDYYYRLAGLAMLQYPAIINLSQTNTSQTGCYGNRDLFSIQLEFLKKFITKFEGKRKFAFFWNNELTHDDFNGVQNGDEPIHDFFTWLKTNGHTRHSIVIFASDHGFRIGGASETYTGRLENNMPLLMIHVPDVLLQKHCDLKQAMTYNTDKLLSAYDIHETIMAVINKRFEGEESKHKLIKHIGSHHVQRSLFSKLPKLRTCTDAGIPDQFCTCDDVTLVSINNPLILPLAERVVMHINKLLHDVTHLCRPLMLLNISEARVNHHAVGDQDHNPIYRHPGLLQRLKGATSDESGRYWSFNVEDQILITFQSNSI